MTVLETIKHLKTILPAERFVLTGSYALSKIGLTIWTETLNDLDIILYKPTDEALATAQRLMDETPAATKPKEGYVSKLGLKYIFKFNDIKIDIFIQEAEPKATLLVENGEIEINNTVNIFAAKKLANREKDWKQLYQIARGICTLNDFLKSQGFLADSSKTPVII